MKIEDMSEAGDKLKGVFLFSKNWEIVDTCYNKHGFPPQFKKNYTATNCFSKDTEDFDDNASIASRKSKIKNPGSLSFTP